MKTWLQRTLIGAAVSAALVGSLAAYSQTVPADPAVREARMLEHVGKRLNLNADQSAKLKALADLLHAQRAAGGDLHQRAQALIAGNTFDRAGAQLLVNQKIGQIQTGSPAVINAVGNFFDSLDAAQQQQVRDFVSHAGHRGRWGHRGDASAPAGN